MGRSSLLAQKNFNNKKENRLSSPFFILYILTTRLTATPEPVVTLTR